MKAVVIFSGGLDSTVLLHYLKSLGYELYGLSFFYKQRHSKELEYAKYWSKLCKEWKLISIDFLGDLSSSALTTDKEIPKTHYTDSTQQITVVPNRNMVMLSIAVAWAEELNADVFYGAHSNDRTIYPDCRLEFVEALSKASQLGTYKNVRIHAPFVYFKKSQLVSLGNKLGVDFKKTWSCYEGGDIPCRLCATCQERIEAFKEAGVVDG